MRTVSTNTLKKKNLKWVRASDEPYDYIEALDANGDTVAVYSSNVWPEHDWQRWELTRHGESVVKP